MGKAKFMGTELTAYGRYPGLRHQKLAIAAVTMGCTPENFHNVFAATKAVMQRESGQHDTRDTRTVLTMPARPHMSCVVEEQLRSIGSCSGLVVGCCHC